MKKRFVLLLCVLIVTALPAGCGPGQSSRDADHKPEREIVSDGRVSVLRQGLSRNFVLSEEGIYCLREEDTLEYDGDGNAYTGRANFVLYCDKHSDHFIKLCDRADCMHNDHTCNAWINDAMRLGYYGGSLYYIDMTPGQTTAIIERYPFGQEAERLPPVLCRMEKNGRSKEKVAELCTKEEMERYNSATPDEYSLGYVEIEFGEAGMKQLTRRYIDLGGKPEVMEIPDPRPDEKTMTVSNTDGGKVILKYWSGLHQEKDENGRPVYASLYAWDPKENTVEVLGNIPFGCSGYYGLDGAYYVEKGILYRWDYEKEAAEELFDTGFTEGNMLYRFNDFFIAADMLVEGEAWASQKVTLQFFSREYQPLGSCEIELLPEEATIRRGENLTQRMVMFGETEDRVLFCKSNNPNSALPAYYIEKSDFGTGEIRLHEYHFPEE